MPFVSMTSEEAAVREFVCDMVMLVWQASGTTKTAFARAVGLTPQQLSNYASYLKTPPHAVVARIADYAGLERDFFYPKAKTRASNTPLAKRARALRAKHTRDEEVSPA